MKFQEFSEKPSRKWMDHFLFNKSPSESYDWQITNLPEKSQNSVFFDSFRHFHPERKEAFTCWNTSANCRSTNFGTRIDYILSSNDLKGDA